MSSDRMSQINGSVFFPHKPQKLTIIESKFEIFGIYKFINFCTIMMASRGYINSRQIVNQVSFYLFHFYLLSN